MRLRYLAVSLLSLAAATAGAQSAKSAQSGKSPELRVDFTKETLPNGLTVIYHVDHTTPVATVLLWYNVGSKMEQPGRTGFAHLFEHMMFQGSKNVEKGQHFGLLEAAGGRAGADINGTTNQDRTNYYEQVPSNQLELALWLEADRMGTLTQTLTKEKLDNQRDVVKNERRQSYDNQPYGTWGEKTGELLFPDSHPYHHSVIGSMTDLSAASVEDVQKFFKTYYAPNNLTLVLAGDLVPERVFELAKRYFESIARQEPPGQVRTQEPEQLGERQFVIRRKAQTPLLQYAYKAPAAADASGPAVNLLLSILVDGDSSRLHRALVEEKQLAIEVGGHWQEGFDPGLLWLFLTLPEGAEVAAVQAAVDAELAGIAEHGVTDAELARAKNMTAAGFWKKLATIDGKAQLLGEYEVFHGDWLKLFDAPAQVDRVTRAQVQAVAREILDKRRRTVGVLLPEEGVLTEEDEAA
jgi:zinc protease